MGGLLYTKERLFNKTTQWFMFTEIFFIHGTGALTLSADLHLIQHLFFTHWTQHKITNRHNTKNSTHKYTSTDVLSSWAKGTSGNTGAIWSLISVTLQSQLHYSSMDLTRHTDGKGDLWPVLPLQTLLLSTTHPFTLPVNTHNTLPSIHSHHLPTPTAENHHPWPSQHLPTLCSLSQSEPEFYS